MNIQEKLFELQDSKNALFQSKLAPTITVESCIGVRMPDLRKLAKEIEKSKECEAFLNELPHKYYDENMLHSVLLSGIKDYDTALMRVEAFLPYVDNWAACDTLSPKAFKKNRPALMEKIRVWAASSETYTCRFGLDMLMSHFLDEDFKPEYLDIAASAKSDEYYVKMMVAWYFATALAKQWDATLPYIENKVLAPWTHNKTIQKAIESYRITEEQKTYLRTLKVKTK